MPLSFQTHKSNQEISQIIDNLNVNKNGNLSTNSGEKTGDEIVTAKDVKLMKRFYLTKDKGYTPTRTEIEGISETERTWDFEQILPENFNVTKVTQITNAYTTANSQNIFYFSTKNGENKQGVAYELSSSKGVIIDLQSEIYFVVSNVRPATSGSATFNVDISGEMKTITKVEFTDSSLPDSDTNKFILAVEGYFE